MARPETIDDIELENIQIAVFQVDSMGVNPDLLLGYAAFLKAMEKAKAIITASYSTVTVTRYPNAAESKNQLETKQSSYDERKRQYEIFASVGKCEYNYLETSAKRYAEEENLPWPPETHSEIRPFDVVIRDIDAVVAE